MPRAPDRITMRAASRFVSRFLRLPYQVAKDPPADLAPEDKGKLTPEELKRFQGALRRAGTHAMMMRLTEAMRFDVPLSKGKGQKEGRPTRHWLRRRLRALLLHIKRRAGMKPDSNARGANKTLALLLMLYDLDFDRDERGVWWRADGTPAPKGWPRVRWITERLGDLLEVRTGDYQSRKAKRGLAGQPPASTQAKRKQEHSRLWKAQLPALKPSPRSTPRSLKPAIAATFKFTTRAVQARGHSDAFAKGIPRAATRFDA